MLLVPLPELRLGLPVLAQVPPPELVPGSVPVLLLSVPELPVSLPPSEPVSLLPVPSHPVHR